MTAHDEAIQEAAKALAPLWFDGANITGGKHICDNYPGQHLSMQEAFLYQARLAVESYLTALHRIDGSKVMPREAMEEMKTAGMKAWCEDTVHSYHERAGLVYRAMHDAKGDGE